MVISPTQLHANPYAPEGANSVNLYNTQYASNLTVGQLVSAVCLRVGAVLERLSIRLMNDLNKCDTEIDDLSDTMQQLGRLSTESALSNPELKNFQNSWADVRAGLIVKFGLTGLSNDVSTYAGRMESMTAIKKEIESRMHLAQETMIEIKNLINRREVAMSTASNVVRTQGQTKQNTAAKM